MESGDLVVGGEASMAVPTQPIAHTIGIIDIDLYLDALNVALSGGTRVLSLTPGRQSLVDRVHRGRGRSASRAETAKVIADVSPRRQAHCCRGVGPRLWKVETSTVSNEVARLPALMGRPARSGWQCSEGFIVGC